MLLFVYVEDLCSDVKGIIWNSIFSLLFQLISVEPLFSLFSAKSKPELHINLYTLNNQDLKLLKRGVKHPT